MIELTAINDIPALEYPIYESMQNSTLIRFSKWECAKYWANKPKSETAVYSYNEVMTIYEKLIKRLEAK